MTGSDDDDDTVARSRDESTVLSVRRGSGAEHPASQGTPASGADDETVVRPRATARGIREEPAGPPSPHRRTASSGQPENTVYRPRAADPLIVPRTHG